jgi:tetratricopeptide (TPR) repeat protein
MSESPEVLRLKQAERNLDQARKEHDRRVQDARQALKRAQKEQSRAIEEAQKALQDERTRWATPVEHFSDAQLYRDHVQRGTQSLALSASMSSNISTSETPQISSSPATPSSTGATGNAPDQSSQNSQETAPTPTLTLTLSTGQGSIQIPADPAHQDAAYEFASHVLTAGKNAAASIAAHQHSLQLLQQAVQSAQTTAPQVDQAKKNLDDVEKAMGAIQSASLHLDQVRQATPPDILRKYDRSNRNRQVGIIISAVIVIIVVLVAFIAWFFMR